MIQLLLAILTLWTAQAARCDRWTAGGCSNTATEHYMWGPTSQAECESACMKYQSEKGTQGCCKWGWIHTLGRQNSCYFYSDSTRTWDSRSPMDRASQVCLMGAEAAVGFGKDDANIWGAIEGEFSEKGEETGPITPGGSSSSKLPGGASCSQHGACASGWCKRGTCTEDDDDWRNQDSEAAVGSGSNGVPTQTAYYLANWNKNSCAWATGVQVMTEKECLSGINSLGWGITKLGWTGNSGTVPKGCSFDPKSKKGHFNSHSSGHGRSDLRPLCKSKSYDDKCGCMYAYCEDKYGVGNTNSCCEFYRDPQSSHCNGREAAVGFGKDDANIWGAIEGEFSEKGEETGPITPGGSSSSKLPGGASCSQHGACASGWCKRGTCTADDDDWRNQEVAVSSGRCDRWTAGGCSNTATEHYMWGPTSQAECESACMKYQSEKGTQGCCKWGWIHTLGRQNSCYFYSDSTRTWDSRSPMDRASQVCLMGAEAAVGFGKDDANSSEIAVTADLSSTSPVVYAFAALGFGFIMYGAAKHFSGAKTEEERTPFNV